MSARFTIQQLEDLKSKGKILSYSIVKKSAAKKPKYRNNKVEFDGMVFDSKKEFERWKVLKILLKSGAIGLLERQVTYELQINKTTVAKYIADFKYIVSRTGETVVEDVKSEITRKLPAYRLKNKLMKAIYNIEIKEV